MDLVQRCFGLWSTNRTYVALIEHNYFPDFPEQNQGNNSVGLMFCSTNTGLLK
jgi:hypothetical protein